MPITTEENAPTAALEREDALARRGELEIADSPPAYPYLGGAPAPRIGDGTHIVEPDVPARQVLQEHRRLDVGACAAQLPHLEDLVLEHGRPSRKEDLTGFAVTAAKRLLLHRLDLSGPDRIEGDS